MSAQKTWLSEAILRGGFTMGGTIGRGIKALLVLAVVLPLGCKKAADSGSSGTGQTRTIRIGMVAKSEANDVFQAAHTGAVDAAKELGDKYGVNVEIEWRTPPNEDPAAQANAINSLTNEKVDAMLISCSAAQMLTPAIDDAVDKGVMVLCFDSDAPQSKRMCDYGTNDTQLGHLLMSELARYMGDKGTVAILGGNQTGPNLQKRIAAVREELARHPNMQELNGPGNGAFYHDEEPGAAAQKIGQVMAANPGKIDGWVFIGGWPLFTENALSWPNPGSIKVVSCDALPKQLGYLRSGYVNELISQDCYGWGHRTVEIVLDKILNAKDPDGMDPATHAIPNPLTLVTKDPPDPSLPVEAGTKRMGVDDFAGYWDKWLKK
jgi:ribose transport system substrate-binding protein